MYHWRLAVKVVLKQLDVDGGRHEDDLEIRALLDEAFHHAEKEVSVKMPFVDLVQNDHVVRGKTWIA